MNTVSKRELSESVHAVLVDKYGMHTPHRSMVLDVVDKLMDEMVNAIVRGDRIEIRGFAVFTPIVRKARTARNPKTGAPVEVPARTAVFFKPGKEFKERLNKVPTSNPPASSA